MQAQGRILGHAWPEAEAVPLADMHALSTAGLRSLTAETALMLANTDAQHTLMPPSGHDRIQQSPCLKGTKGVQLSLGGCHHTMDRAS